MTPTPHADISILPLDHPGANDPTYRLRRDEIARLARAFQKNHKVPFVNYSAEEDQTWKTVVAKLLPLHQNLASVTHLDAQKNLRIPHDKVPQLKELNDKLQKIHGFKLAPVEGLIDSRSFLSALSLRTMFCTQYIRHASRPEYTPEPDIVHEVMGHVPAFTDQAMAEFSELIGKIAQKASGSQFTALERLYWFTIEFGLMQEKNGVKAFGAGLLSSIGEIQHCFTDKVERKPFNFQEVISTDYDYSQMQPILFVMPSFEQVTVWTKEFFKDVL